MKSRWWALSASVFVFLVYAANVPFYAGSSLGERYSWRMEHGRVTVERSRATTPEPFWLDINSEGLSFAWDWNEYGPGEWTLVLPLWIPLALCLLWLLLAWRSGRESAASTG